MSRNIRASGPRLSPVRSPAAPAVLISNRGITLMHRQIAYGLFRRRAALKPMPNKAIILSLSTLPCQLYLDHPNKSGDDRERRAFNRRHKANARQPHPKPQSAWQAAGRGALLRGRRKRQPPWNIKIASAHLETFQGKADFFWPSD